MMNLLNPNAMLISLACIICASVSSAAITGGKNDLKDINTSFMKIFEKFEILTGKVNQLEASEIQTLHASILELHKKFEKLQENKDDRITELLSKLVDQQKKSSFEAKSELEVALSSECTSMCQSKSDKWANETRLSFKHNVDSLDSLISNKSSLTKDQKLGTVCYPNPCLHGGHCELMSDGSGYRCRDCPYPTSGKNCELFNCGDNRCFYHNEIFYELFDVVVNWDNAHRMCLRGGMTLALPKDQKTCDFLITKTRAIYGGGHLWVGLKLIKGENQWQWVDGSPLGVYKGGKEDKFMNHVGNRCCLMYIGGGHVFCTPVDCATGSYLICEKRYSTG